MLTLQSLKTRKEKLVREIKSLTEAGRMKEAYILTVELGGVVLEIHFLDSEEVQLV